MTGFFLIGLSVKPEDGESLLLGKRQKNFRPTFKSMKTAFQARSTMLLVTPALTAQNHRSRKEISWH